jgi:hypothetical protein
MAQSPFFRLAASRGLSLQTALYASTWIEKNAANLAVTATDHQADRLSIG